MRFRGIEVSDLPDTLAGGDLFGAVAMPGFAALADAHPDGLMVLDAAGVVIAYNQAAASIHDLARDQAVGASIAELRREGMLASTGDGSHPDPNAPIAVKEAVLPFRRFRRMDGSGVDSLLGPEMKSTGEVMGIDTDFPAAFLKSQLGAGMHLPREGTLFVFANSFQVFDDASFRSSTQR